MSFELYNLLIERAKYFLELAKISAKDGHYDLGLFNLEQALQLSLKAYLLKTKGDFPRTHDLNKLIELTELPCLIELEKKMWFILSILQDAYTGSRYLLRQYTKIEYENAEKFVESAFRCMSIIST